MKLNEVIFYDSWPSIDLHGFDRDTAALMIDDFIKENVKLKNNIITIVHGIGSGILKEATIKVLNKNKFVLDYKICPYNIGMTIVEIKFDK